jgi:3-hydroxyisobutyrate dehydrogenase
MAAERVAKPEVAFVGLGNMGCPMARRLLAAGYGVCGYDLSAQARSALGQSGGYVAVSAAEAIRDRDIAILMLPDSRVVSEVMKDPAVRAGLTPGATVVDMSSSEPAVTRALAGVLGEHGVTLVDAPVSGGVRRAESGELAIMVGGAPDEVARVQEVLRVFGHIYHAGPVGAGHAVKALNNLMSATHLLVTSEAILAGQRFGLDTDVMLAIFNASSGRSGSTENKWPNFIAPRTFDSGFALQLMVKDMRIATTLAEQMGAPSRLGNCAVEVWAKAADELPPDADHTQIASWLRHDAKEEK